jgi:hypothetical protein
VADLIFAAGAFDAVLDAVATSYPLGNCDSPRPETSLRLLDSTRGGFSSPLAAQLLIRGFGSARPLPEELVNYASFHGLLSPLHEEPDQPAWPHFSPVTWDYPWPSDALLAGGLFQPCSFKELVTHYHEIRYGQQNDIHNLSTTAPPARAPKKRKILNKIAFLTHGP